MNILLTGGNGLIGSQLGIELTKLGYNLITVSRNPRNSEINSTFPAKHYGWDELNQVCALKIDAVIHLAGESVASGFWTRELKKKIFESRILSTKNLVKAFESSSNWPKVWINASAIGIYGDRGDEELEENSSLGNGFLADVCKEWETALTGVPSSCRIVKMRTGVVLSKRQGVLGAMMPSFRLGVAGVLGTGKQWMSWIHEEDCISLILFCLKNEEIHGAINAVSQNPVTNQEFTTLLNQQLGKKNFFPVPKLVLSLLGELSTLFLFSQRVLPKKALANGFKFKYLTLKSALSDVVDYQRQSGVFELFQAQYVDKPIDKVFEYFCDEKNLESLTPDLLSFKVIGKSTPQIQEGTLIDYKLKIRGFPAKWRTKILNWQPGVKFVDTQLKGPYSLWHHTHEFETLGSGTLMKDRVLFKIPMWPLSVFMLPLIKNDVGKIFSFRKETIFNLFNRSKRS